MKLQHRLLVLPLIAMVLMVTGCKPPEQLARDGIATFSGTLAKAQQEYLASCSANPAQAACTTINKGVRAQNAAITSLETYCQFNLNAPLPPVGTKCNPVKSAGDGLKSAMNNLNQLMKELQSINKPTAMIWRYGPGGDTAHFRFNQREREPDYPTQPEPLRGDLSAEAIALALLALKQLLGNLKLGKAGEVAGESIDAVEAGITEYEQYQSTEVTMEQLEGMKLHTLWPDPPPATSGNQVNKV